MLSTNSKRGKEYMDASLDLTLLQDEDQQIMMDLYHCLLKRSSTEKILTYYHRTLNNVNQLDKISFKLYLDELNKLKNIDKFAPLVDISLLFIKKYVRDDF